MASEPLAPLPVVATRLEYRHWLDENPLRAARLAKGLTQPILATLVGCSLSTISKYENGGAYPSQYIGSKLALELGISDIRKQLRAWRKRIPR